LHPLLASLLQKENNSSATFKELEILHIKGTAVGCWTAGIKGLTMALLLLIGSVAAPSITSADRDDKISPTVPRGAHEPAVAKGNAITTNQGLRIDAHDNALKAGPMGPTLMEGHHFREKIT
jgi:hypothetical protein